jgi:hypothetical protein
MYLALAINSVTSRTVWGELGSEGGEKKKIASEP